MEGMVISWNSGAEALYGWSSEEAVGRNARELIVPEDAEAAERLVVELRRDGRWDGELLVRRKDGSTFTAYVRNRLILDEDGGPSAIVGVAVDISARVAAETELLQSRNYAQAVTECMGEGLFTLDVDGPGHLHQPHRRDAARLARGGALRAARGRCHPPVVSRRLAAALPGVRRSLAR